MDDALDVGLKKVTFSGGEPLLNPEFHKFSEYFHKNSVGITIETNGTLLSDEEILNSIKNCNVYCAVSLDGATPETHNRHRCNKNAFAQTVHSIDALEKEKMAYQIIMAISNFNYHEVIAVLELIKERWKYCDSFKLNVVSALGRAKQMDEDGLLFKAEDLNSITEDIAPLVGKYPFKILLHIDTVFFSFRNLMRKYSCGGYCGYRYGLSILANGNVSICSMGKQMEKYIFGHITNIDLKDTWESNPILVDIREDTHRKLKGVCSNCIFRKRCLGGCRAEAVCAYGDFFAPNPLCQELYESGAFPESKLIDASVLTPWVY